MHFPLPLLTRHTTNMNSEIHSKTSLEKNFAMIPNQSFLVFKLPIHGVNRDLQGELVVKVLGAGVLGDGQFTGGDGGPLIVVPGGDSLEEFLIATTLEEIRVSGDGFVSRPCR